MFSVDMPGARLDPTGSTSIVTSINPVGSGPGLGLNLKSHDIELLPNVTTATQNLTDITTNASIVMTSAAGKDGSVTRPGQPILPLEIYNVSPPATETGYVLRGVGFREGDYSDLPNIQPLNSVPATEFAGLQPLFISNVFFPTQPWSANYYDLLADSTGETRLMLKPGQYRSNTPTSPIGTLRTFSRMNMRLFYSRDRASSTCRRPIDCLCRIKFEWQQCDQS